MSVTVIKVNTIFPIRPEIEYYINVERSLGFQLLRQGISWASLRTELVLPLRSEAPLDQFRHLLQIPYILIRLGKRVSIDDEAET